MPAPRGPGILPGASFQTTQSAKSTVLGMLPAANPRPASPAGSQHAVMHLAAVRPRRYVALVLLLVGLTLVTQFRQTRYATGRLASDARNPFAYVPTRRDIETVGPWLQQLAEVAPNKSVEPIAVIGGGYWPLPWYLRSFKTIGYYRQEPPARIAEFPIVFCVPESADAVMTQLATTHTPLPRGLRANVAITLFVRNDIWSAWMKAGTP